MWVLIALIVMVALAPLARLALHFSPPRRRLREIRADFALTRSDHDSSEAKQAADVAFAASIDERMRKATAKGSVSRGR